MPVKNKFKELISKLSAIKVYYSIITRFLISLNEKFTQHPAVIFFQNLPIPIRFFSRKNPVINYFYKLISTLVEAVLLVAATGTLCFLIYYTMGMFWYLYLGTPMGDKFISLHPDRAQTIIALSELDLMYFCAEVTLSSFVICFALSSICRFMHISHYLYLSQGLFGKLVYWGIPLTVAVSYYIKKEYGFSDWEVTACIVMIPTYLMLISCFKYSQKLIPEIGDVLKISVPWIKHSYQLIYVKITDLTREL